MAVIVSDNRNPSYNQMLATTDGFYRAEAYNVGADNSTNLALSTTRFIPLTLANNGNMMGISLGLTALSTSLTPYGVLAEMEENVGNATLTIASPCVVTKASHGFIGGEEITLATTGALPTGLTATTKYYIKYIDVNTFNLSLTLGGANINTSGTQSGTHTVWQMRLKKEMTSAEINPEYIYNTPMGTSGVNNFGSFVPFKFASSYPVTTATNKWRIKIFDGRSLGNTSIWSLITSDSTNPHYAAWCDNKVTSANGDVLYVVDKVLINKSFTTGAILGTGTTVVGVAACICRSMDMRKAGTCLLEWENPPVASYTLNVTGLITMGTFAGFRVGSESARIPFAQQAIITRPATPVAGTAGCGFNHIVGSTASRARGGASIFLYGEVPTKPYGILASNAAISQPNIELTEDLSSNWQAGDYVYVGKQNTQGQGTTAWQQILSISGTTITLTSNLLTYSRVAGGYVINRDRGWGIVMSGNSNPNYFALRIEQPRYNELSGVKFDNTYLIFYIASSYYNYPKLPSNRGKWVMEDNFFLADSTTTYYLATFICPQEGFSIKRNIGFRYTFVNGWLSYYGDKTVSAINFNSGLVEIKNNISLATYSQVILPPSNGKVEIDDNVWQNAANSSARIYVSGIYFKARRNKFWGMGNNGSNGATIAFLTSSAALLEDNEYDNCACVYNILAGAFALSAVLRREKFGVELTNLFILYTITVGYYDITLLNSSNTVTVDTGSDLTLAIPQSRFNIVNENNVANADRIIVPNGYFQRTGNGLTDTIARTAGTDKFALRFEPSTGEMFWEFDVPTANIQSKSMAVLVWMKINSANYYSGTHVMPTLSVNYDDGTIVSAAAAQSTDWQLVLVSFTPTTTTSKITVKISGETDQSGSNAYFYIDDMSILYPAGHQLNLGGLDVWDKALPVSPPISTSLSAQDVWAVPIEGLSGDGTTGKKLRDTLTTGLFIALN